MPEVTGRLESWFHSMAYEGECVMWGRVYDDREGRWPDGTWIHTSGIVVTEFKEGDVVETRNSTYTLGKPVLAPVIGYRDGQPVVGEGE